MQEIKGRGHLVPIMKEAGRYIEAHIIILHIVEVADILDQVVPQVWMRDIIDHLR